MDFRLQKTFKSLEDTISTETSTNGSAEELNKVFRQNEAHGMPPLSKRPLLEDIFPIEDA